MEHYRVQFYKKVMGGHYREVDSCQWDADEIAANQDDALRTAAERFCKARGLRHWSAHADRYQVIHAEPVPQAGRPAA